MMRGRNNGKKLMAVRILKHAFEIIHLLTDANPLQILVDAVQNTGPREDSTRIGSQGTVRRQAVDVSPLRRVNQAISLLTIGVSLLPRTTLHEKPWASRDLSRESLTACHPFYALQLHVCHQIVAQQCKTWVLDPYYDQRDTRRDIEIIAAQISCAKQHLHSTLDHYRPLY